MRGWSRALAIAAAFAFCAAFVALASEQQSPINEKDPWPALTDEERTWTKRGLNAVLLYREEHSDLTNSSSTHFYRIKILTREGRNYGDVEILYAPGVAELKDLQARTIQPDGSIVPFQGQLFDNTLVKVRKTRLLSRSFSFPEVQPGSILEYRYRLEWKHDATPSMRFTLDHRLATRLGRFSLKPYVYPGPDARLEWTSNSLVTAQPRFQADGSWQLEVRNLPPFKAEEFMPPDEEVRPWVQFHYEDSGSHEKVTPVKANPEETLDDRWTQFAKRVDVWVGKFGDKDRILRETVAAVTAPSDPPETKLRKLYERVQKLRNLTFQPPDDKIERVKLEENENVEDILRRGYATDTHMNILFAALARAAGFKSWVVLTADRESTFFSPAGHQYSSLSETLALVEVGGRERFYDPGTLYCPFGTVSWEKTGMPGLRLLKGGGLWVKVPVPEDADNRTLRTLRLRETEGGVLDGNLQLVFSGQEAIRRRQEAYDDDDFGRSRSLEDEVKGWLPDGSSVEVLKAGPWDSPDPPLEAELHVRIRGMVARTAHRMIVPLSVLWVGTLPTLYHPGRTYDVYFQYARQDKDEVHFRLPEGYRPASLPAPRSLDSGSVHFETTCRTGDGEIVFERQETISGFLFKGPEQRARLLGYFYASRIADEDRTILYASEPR